MDKTIVEKSDKWAKWIVTRRFGGSSEITLQAAKMLESVRDRIFRNAEVQEGNAVLDIGTGDGLLGIYALDSVGPSGTVVFQDISSDCLTVCKELLDRLRPDCQNIRFVKSSAEDLRQIGSTTIDVIVSRAVLLYIPDRARCFTEYFRVLKPGGRIVLNEPINRFKSLEQVPYSLFGYDVQPVAALAEKIKKGYKQKPVDEDTMTNFDERDLYRWAVDAGFSDITVEYTCSRKTQGRYASYEALIHTAPNPTSPTLFEVMQEVLTVEEQRELEDYLKPCVDQGTCTRLYADVYLTGVKL